MKNIQQSPTRSTAESHVARSVLLTECLKLKASMVYDEKGGFHLWPQGEGSQIAAHFMQCGICTNGARLLAKKFGGLVAGYLIDPQEPTSLVGANVFGHDFAVIGGFIVDWWGWEYEQSIQSPVMAVAEGVALGKYKPEQAWDIFPGNDFTIQTITNY